MIVHGRDDAILAPNHTSRPYYALSRRADGGRSRISYWEVLNAQHLDAFNAFPDFAARFVPLHYYFIQALDLLYAHLNKGPPAAEPGGPHDAARQCGDGDHAPPTCPRPAPNPALATGSHSMGGRLLFRISRLLDS